MFSLSFVYKLHCLAYVFLSNFQVDDLARSTKIEELSSLILSEPLATLCPTATSSCLITEQFFDCNEDLSASSVTFRARLEHRSTDSAVAANAFPLVAEIESWVIQTSAITLNSQRLRFVTSCAVGISDATASYCPAIAGASGLSADSGTVLGGTIGAVIGVCAVTIIIILVLQIVCLKAMKDSRYVYVTACLTTCDLRVVCACSCKEYTSRPLGIVKKK